MIARVLPAGALLALVALLAAGCGCGKSQTGNPCPEPGLDCCNEDSDCWVPEAPGYMECCLVTNECIELPDEAGEEDDGCEPGSSCDSVNDVMLVQGETEEDGCYVDWSCCEPRDPLPLGKIGTYSSMGIAADGTVWLSGYAAGVSETSLYGDLASATWDEAAGEPDWELLDGIPWDATPYAPPDGWRGGINEPGDDVGLYTSLGLDGSDEPRIAYHDHTNGTLKYIAMGDGAWADPVVADGGGHAGEWASMLLISGDVPVVAYRAHDLSMEDYTGASYQVGRVVTSVRYARSGDASGSSWTVEEVASSSAPCWGTVCPEDHRCRVADGLCWPEDRAGAGCLDEMDAYSCASEEACLEELDGAGAPLGTYACVDAVSEDPVFDLPEGIGLWTSLALAPDGTPEVVYYDRTRGELVWVEHDGTGWAAPVVLDGDDLSTDTDLHGDRGWHASLTIDDTGTRHISYVDGLAEALMYMQLDPAGTVAVREVVDDGATGGADRDLVGDYSAIVVDADGRVRLAYQNTSQGLVEMAVRSTSDGTWTMSTLSDPDAGFMGYYLNQVLVDGTSWFSQFTFNYELDPFYRGLRVFSCTVGTDDTATCG